MKLTCLDTPVSDAPCNPVTVHRLVEAMRKRQEAIVADLKAMVAAGRGADPQDHDEA